MDKNVKVGYKIVNISFTTDDEPKTQRYCFLIHPRGKDLELFGFDGCHIKKKIGLRKFLCLCKYYEYKPYKVHIYTILTGQNLDDDDSILILKIIANINIPVDPMETIKFKILTLT